MPVPKYEIIRSGRLYHETVLFHFSLQGTQNKTNRRRWLASLNSADIQLLLNLCEPTVFLLQPALYKHRLAVPWQGIGRSEGLEPHRTTQTQLEIQNCISFPRVIRIHVCTVRGVQHHRPFSGEGRVVNTVNSRNIHQENTTVCIAKDMYVRVCIYICNKKALKGQSFIYSPTDALVSCLKQNNTKIYFKIYIKTTPTCFGVTVTV